MSNSRIGVGTPEAVDLYLDTEQVTVESVAVQRERVQVAGAAATEVARVRDTPPVIADHGLVVRPLRLAQSPQVTYVTETAVAAGGSGTLDSAQVGSGKTGYLEAVLVSASVPFKAELRTVSNGVASANKAVKFCGPGVRELEFRPPRPNYITAAHDAGAGLDGFRVVVTNLDPVDAADVYVTFLWDEV